MEHGYSYLMFLLAAGMAIYAALVRADRYDLIPKNWAANPKDKKAYAKEFSNVLFLTACAPLLSGIVGLFGSSGLNIGIAAAVLIVSFILLMKTGIERMNSLK